MYRIHFTPNDKGTPPGKLADVELQFKHGALAGLRLLGFGLWQRRGSVDAYNVTMPARQYSVNGERRSFSLLRAMPDTTDPATISHSAIVGEILDAWRARTQQPAAVGYLTPTTYDATPPPLDPGAPESLHTPPVQAIISETYERIPTVDARAALDYPPVQAFSPVRADWCEPIGTPPYPVKILGPAEPEIQRYDNPADAARAAQAGTPINILDLIRHDTTNASETREHQRPTVRAARPGFTPAGDPIGF